MNTRRIGAAALVVLGTAVLAAQQTIAAVSLVDIPVAAVLTRHARNPLANALPGPITAAREFEAGDTLMLFAEVYEAQQRRAPYTLDLAAVLRTDDGREVRKVEDQRSSTELQGAARGGYGFTAVIPLEGLTPGLYVIHVEARANIGDRPTVSRDVLIRVK